MRAEPDTPHRSYRLVLVSCVGTLAILATGCSSSKHKVTTTLPPAAHNISAPATSSSAPTSAAPPTSAALTTPAASAGLSGSWSGNYSGAFTGTFTLSWQQTGSSLSGSITLSTSPGALPLNGTVNGSRISFGTVGSAAITYTGTVSGSSMSGTYQVGGAAGGNWSATKT
jgi:hypothetical protein